VSNAETKVKWRTRVPWVTKLRPDLKPKVVADPRGRGTMLVPTPMLVAEEIRRTRRGRLVTPAALRFTLAARFGTDKTCPFTTGIFLHIVAGAAEEQLAAGRRPVAPYWRVVGESGELNPKSPPGPARQAAHLRREGHRVRRRAGPERWHVVGVEPSLMLARRPIPGRRGRHSPSRSGPPGPRRASRGRP